MANITKPNFFSFFLNFFRLFKFLWLVISVAKVCLSYIALSKLRRRLEIPAIYGEENMVATPVYPAIC